MEEIRHKIRRKESMLIIVLTTKNHLTSVFFLFCFKSLLYSSGATVFPILTHVLEEDLQATRRSLSIAVMSI